VAFLKTAITDPAARPAKNNDSFWQRKVLGASPVLMEKRSSKDTDRREK
jgi:hypothetical protein